MNLTIEYKTKVCAESYVGTKGYTIPKSVLTPADLEFLKKDLFLKPQTPGPSFGPALNDAFPVYRENEKKIYIPRFYGIERYGMPERSEIAPGIDINLTFPRELRDYQNNIVDIYMNAGNQWFPRTPLPSISGTVDNELTTSGGRAVSEAGAGAAPAGILEIYCGAGKTVMALKIVSLIQKKTLILVHKEFLMNQWIERIEEFLPGARVGKIQASTCDIENKDIVIGLIQTMYNKVFPQEVYSQFGLTIIDEVHRIGSEEFSKTLLKTITPYMLGISATVERKDKLTKLLYMFIGPKIHSMLRKQEDTVQVRGIEFVTNDSDFNEVEYDFRGQPKYSTMISKICAYGPRSDFIVKAIRDLLKENPGAQIMVLAHNRSLLTYLHETLNAGQGAAAPLRPPVETESSVTVGRAVGEAGEGEAPATVGFYVGGMKQKDLQATESKQIVLATYAMAAEALDIKTLSILLMATPKTDITQSVGRILRVKHANPIIVDIIDSHQLFQNQWKLRKRFYKKANYKIVTSTSKKYADMATTDWFKVFDPKVKTQDDDDENDIKKNATDFGGKCCIDVSGL
jgi:superfamily II DNA or RNA helicase